MNQASVVSQWSVVKGQGHDQVAGVTCQRSRVSGQGSEVVVQGSLVCQGLVIKGHWSMVKVHWSNHFLQGSLVRGHWSESRITGP